MTDANRNEYVIVTFSIALWIVMTHNFMSKLHHFRKTKAFHIINSYRWFPGCVTISKINLIFSVPMMLSFFTLYMIRFSMSEDIFHATFSFFAGYIFINWLWMMTFFEYHWFKVALPLSLLQACMISVYTILALTVNNNWRFAVGFCALPMLLFDFYLVLCCYVIVADLEKKNEPDPEKGKGNPEEEPATPQPPRDVIRSPNALDDESF